MPEEQRVIFHCDCNSFYASVELLRYPGCAACPWPYAAAGRPPWHHLAKNEPPQSGTASDGRNRLERAAQMPGLKLLPPTGRTGR